MTNGEINRIGLRLKNPLYRNEAIEDLANYRQSFYQELSAIYKYCFDFALKLEMNAIVVARFKRYSTIISKLERFPSMKLSQIQDIAGCRLIFEKEESIIKLVSQLRLLNGYTLREDDYINSPKESGYRSYHVVLTNNNNNRKVEVQIRTRDHHNWATLVETTDVIFNTSLKENSQPKLFFDVLKILSIPDEEIGYNELKILVKFNNKHRYINRLMQVFTKNIKGAEDIWRKSKPNFKKNFFVIQVMPKDNFELTSFMSKSKAEKTFLESYKLSGDSRSVLISMRDPKFENIVLAYSNYVLLGNDLVIRYQRLLCKLVKQELQKRKFHQVINVYIDLLRLMDLELDWALGYLESNAKSLSKLNASKDFDRTKFGRAMTIRLHALVQSWKELDQLAEGSGILYKPIFKTCRETMQFFHQRSRKKKFEAIQHYLKIKR